MDDPINSKDESFEFSSTELFSHVYDEVHSLAQAWFRQQPLNHTLQPTALVHEAYLKIANSPNAQRLSRSHLLATVAKAMRQILVDHARKRNSQKRGGNFSRIQLDEAASFSKGQTTDFPGMNSEVEFEDLHKAISTLEELNPRQAEIVELRFFGGLTIEEVAQVIKVSARTVKLDWQFARAWLLNELGTSQD